MIIDNVHSALVSVCEYIIHQCQRRSDVYFDRGSASKQQSDLKKMRMADLASGGGDHKLMAREQANALGNMCNMQVCFLLALKILYSKL